MQCLQCRHDNRATARFCRACGAALVHRCPQCAAELAADARFCDHCGCALSGAAGAARPALLADGERRPATVMFCDLSGYSALGERLDPEEVEALLARIKARAEQIIERHGGTLSQFQGDGLLVLFGAPSAHDDDPARAVRAARELHTMVRGLSLEVEQRLGQRLRLHSGISSGLVVTSLRDSRDGSIGITGDAANLAARLATLAPPDAILVSAETRRQVEDYFQTAALTPVSVKGRAEPLQAFRIERETPVQTRFEAARRKGLTRFTGRDAELAAMHEALDRAAAGTAQLVSVEGEPGIGKSRLAFEFRHGLDRSRIGVLEGRCQSHGAATPYQPFVDALRRGLRLHRDETGEALHEHAVAQITGLDERLRAHLPQLLHLLSIPSSVFPLPATLTGVALRDGLERALLALVEASCARRPLALILEDWHWADDGSTSALRRLATEAGKQPLLILLLYRPEREFAIGSAAHTRIRLAPLEPADTHRIVSALLDIERLPEGFSALVHERTSGNPFFTEEIVSALREQGHIEIVDRSIEIRGELATMALPESVQATIRARVDRLPPEQRDVLRMAAVIGREFEDRVLERVFAAPMRADTLQKLVGQDLLQPQRTAQQPEHMFKHVLIQSVVYDTLLLQQRRALHGRAGRAIETLYADRLEQHCEALAWHYSRSGETRKAIDFLEMAGDKAQSVFALDTARERYRDVLALLDGSEAPPEDVRRRVDVTLKLAKASHYAASEDTLAALEKARADALRIDDLLRATQVSALMGGIYRMLGNHPKVFSVLGECAALAAQLGDDEMLASAHHVMGRACYLTGEYASGIAHMERGIAISQRLGNLAEVSYSCGFSADCRAWLGDFAQAFELADRSMQLARDSSDLSRQGGANWYLAAVCCMAGEWERGLEAATRCAELARRIGGAYLLGAGLSTQGWAAFALGHQEHGIDLMKTGLETMETSGSRQGTGLYASWLADACALAGKADEARKYAGKALDFRHRFGEGNGEAPAHRALAWAEALGASPDWVVIEAHLAQSERAAAGRDERPQLAITLLRHAQLARRKGDATVSRQKLMRACELFEQMRMRWWLEEASGELKSLDSRSPRE